jgi:hypothetical protein
MMSTDQYYSTTRVLNRKPQEEFEHLDRFLGFLYLLKLVFVDRLT